MKASALTMSGAITLTGYSAISFAGALWAIASSGNYVLAQIQADGTVGTTVNSSPTLPCTTICDIGGGTTAGNNLFHSFRSFSIPNGAIANFLLQTPAIANIFARVTSGTPSNIQGLIQAQGQANFFLMNPNGILFGPNAQLNIGGSFVGTTANALQFGNQGAFLASTSQNDVSLLTVKPSALLFNQLAAQTITNQSVANPINRSIVDGNGLRVRDGKSLLLVGGNVRLDGGDLRAPGGRVELGGVASNGAVGLFVDGNNLSLSFPNGVARADVTLTQGATVDVSAKGGGSIGINARNLNMAGLSLLQAGIASNKNAGNSQADNIEVNVTEKITFTDGSSVNNSVLFGAKGRAGNVLITADAIAFEGERGLSQDQKSYFRGSGAFSRVREGATGQGGNIEIRARELKLSDGAVITTSTRGKGDAGSVTIIADTVSFDGQGAFDPRLGFRQSSAAFSAVTEFGEGQGGSVDITTRSLSLTNGGAIITSTLGKGDAGNVFINADTVSFDGEGTQSDFKFSGAYSNVLPGATGKGGNVTVTAGTLSLTNGAVVTTSTQGTKNAGNAIIKEAGVVFLDGQSQGGSPSGLLARTQSSGNAGELRVNTGELIVQNGAQVSADTSGTGRAGTLLVNATDSVTVDGKNSRLNFDTRSQRGDAGDAGDLRISTQRLVVRNGAQVSARSSGAGDAGTLLVNATDSVTIDGKDSRLRFDTEGSGNAKGIRIETGQLVVQNGGQVTVSGTGTGNPGNLDVTAGTVFLNNQGGLDQRGLIAETKSGEGGNIRLQVQDTLLMRYQSLISASAQGTGNGGNVEIEAPNGLVVAILSENSDIVASAIQGNGGIARAKAAGVFGFRQFRGFRTSESDFTASSELGIDGRLEIITPDRRLEELPADFETVEIAQGCEAARGQEESSFVVTGRGGLPPNPKEALSSDDVQVPWVPLNPEEENRSSPAVSKHPTSATPVPLVEAQGWVMNDKGQVVLTASALTVTPHNSWQTPNSCGSPQSAPRP
jgi:filamentous hemagglutinin family protein